MVGMENKNILVKSDEVCLYNDTVCIFFIRKFYQGTEVFLFFFSLSLGNSKDLGAKIGSAIWIVSN